MKTTPTTAVFYARFSTDKQNPQSIDDQFADCEKFATREGLKVVHKYCDEGKTAATQHDRPGLATMKRDAKAGKFQMIIVEAQDRLWGDQEDMWHLYKRFTHWGVKIHSLTEGGLDDGKLTMGGHFTAQRLKNISDKVKRAHRGAASRGRFYSIAYGYRRVELVPATNERPAIYDPGKCEPHPENIATLRRIFQETVAFRSPRAICRDLARDGRISPDGTTKWNFSSLTKIIANELYKGVMVTGRTETKRDPDGKVVKTARPENEWVRKLMPELQIIPTKLWDDANRIVGSRARGGPVKGRANLVPRKEYLLAGMLRCAACGGHMRITNHGPRVGCAAANDYDTCKHRQSYDLAKLQAAIIEGMRNHMLDATALTEFVKAHHARRVEHEKKNRREGASISKRHARVLIELDRAADAFLATNAPVLKEKIAKLEAERKSLEARLIMIEAETNVVSLHPSALKAHKATVEKLIEALASNPLLPQHHTAFRNFFDHFVVHPVARRAPYEFTPVARVGALLGVDIFAPAGRTVEEVVTEQGLAVALTNTRGPRGVHWCSRHDIVLLGRWKAAA